MKADLFPEATQEDRLRIKDLHVRIRSKISISLKNPEQISEKALGLSGLIEKIPFGQATVNFVSPWLNLIENLIENSPYVVKAGGLQQSLKNLLIARAQQCLLRTQIQLMQEKRDGLLGKSSEERYENFADWLISKDGEAEYIDSFPVSVSDAQHQAQNFTTLVAEILDHYNNDRAHLFAIGMVSNSRIKSLEIGQGDTHNGRSVAILTFEDETKLVYKPHSLKIEDGYYNLIVAVQELWKKCSLKAPRVVDRELYGWMEFISIKPVTKIDAAYRSMGELLGMMHILRANDMHHENIIMHGNIPVPVDLETIMSSIPPRGGFESNPGLISVSQTVSSVGLLPSALVTPGQETTRGSLDIGAVGYTPGQRSPFSTLVLNRLFTDEMHFTLEFLEHSAPALLPVADVLIQESQIRQGYEDFMHKLLEDQDWFANQVSNLFCDASVRFVALDTMRYSQVLRLATHPELQRRAIDRDLALCRIALFRDSTPDAVIISEIRQLKNGDVPAFTLHTDSTGVFDSEGLLVNDTLDCSPIDHVLNGILNFDSQTLDLNKWLIRLAFASKLKDCPANTEFRFEASAVSIKSIEPALKAGLIADLSEKLHMTAVCKQDKQVPTWIGGRLSNTPSQYWTVDELSMDFYTGSAGIAYNLFYSGKVRKESKSTDLAIEYFEKSIESFSRQNLDWSTVPRGAHAGIESLLWASHEVARVTGNSKLFSKTTELWARAVQELDRSSRDVVSGTSGILLALCSNIEHDSEGKLGELAEAVGSILAKDSAKALKSGEFEYSGFAHGLAGESAALSVWASRSGNDFPAQIVSELISREKQFTNPDGTIRFGGGDTAEARGWCHGAPGLLLSKAIIAASMPSLAQSLSEDISKLTAGVREDSFGGNITLCHGDSGNLWILSDVAMLTSNKALARDTHNSIENYINNIIPDAVQSLNRHTITQSLMVGTGSTLALLLKSAEPSVRSPLWFGA